MNFSVFPKILFCLTLSTIVCACKMATKPVVEERLSLAPVTPTINVTNSETRFYQNIPYSQFKEDLFDMYVPNGKTPAALLINIHGGGFVGGDKAQGISASLINSLMAKNIAVASLNYRFITEDNQGVLKCMNDCKRALQFIRYHSKSFNIDKSNVVLMGGSAGAGTSLWLGFNPDMADKRNPDPVLRESTRVKAVVALSTQATYDILDWPDAVFSEYKPRGFDLKSMLRVAPEKLLLNFYGFKSLSDTGTLAGKAYRRKVDMLALMSTDDPEIYVENAAIAYTIPKTLGELEHHPLHAKALMDRAKKVSLKSKVNIPPMNIDTRNGETRDQFIVRTLRK